MTRTPHRTPAVRFARFGALSLFALAASGCAQLSSQDRDAYAAYPYEYRVGDTPDYATSSIPAPASDTATGRVETGVAAWNGDISQPGLNAAHPYLPRGSWARVTNLANGRAATVRINETLSPRSGRALELSRDAAAAVGALHTGLVTVMIEPLDPRATTPTERERWVRAEPTPLAPIPPVAAAPRAIAPSPVSSIDYDPSLATGSIPTTRAPAPAAPRRVDTGLAARSIDTSYVQLGAFKDSKNAHRLLTRLGAEGLTSGAYGDGFIETAFVGGEIWHRVRLGPLETAGEADRALKDVRALGHNSARLIRP